MRAIWKGAVSFGLVNIPVRLYTATEERDVAFHQVHRQDGSRIRYKRVCQADGAEVPYADIAKGYELPTGETVVLTDEDFADLPLPSSRMVEVLEFVPLEQVDPIYFLKSYYLEPDKQGTKSYVLLRDALESSGMVALVKVAIRSREALATLRTREGVLVLETMLWPDEVRAPDFGFLEEKISPRPQELTMASSLIESMSGDFDPSQYHDDYREALQEVIDAKIAGREVVEPEREAAAPTDRAVDLMAALRRSVEDAKRRRGAGGGPAEAKGAKAGRAASATEAPKKAARKGATAPKKATGRGAAAPKKATGKAASKKAGAAGRGPSAAKGTAKSAKTTKKTAKATKAAKSAKATGTTGGRGKAPAKKAAKKAARRSA